MRNALWLVIAIILIAGGYWWWSMSPNSATTEMPVVVDEGASSVAPVATSSNDTPATTPPATPTTVTVTYDGKAYSPATLAIKKGDTVLFKNASGKNQWVAADEHPTHTEYDSTSRSTHCAADYAGEKPFDQCAPGSDYSFTFTKAGEFEFHDHITPAAHGVVTVQ